MQHSGLHSLLYPEVCLGTSLAVMMICVRQPRAGFMKMFFPRCHQFKGIYKGKKWQWEVELKPE